MSSSRSDWLAVPDFHPEFGLLCPSPRRRRGIRLVLLAIMTTTAIGATMGLAGAYRTDGEGLASTAQPMNERPHAGVSAAGGDATPVHEPCKSVRGLVAFFLNPACESNKPHARRGARATNRVATVILGRTDAAPAPMEATPTPIAGAAIEPSPVDVGNAEKSANSTTAAVERTAPPKKPKAKASAPIALTPPARELSRQNVTLNAYASAPRFGRESYDPYRNTIRATTLRSGFDASFGRSW